MPAPVTVGAVSSRTDASDLTDSSGRTDSSVVPAPTVPSASASTHLWSGLWTRLTALQTALGPQLMRFIQPMKIALVLVPEIRYEQVQNGVWAMLCIAFIRQDNTSSSFLTGFQRLEGTVLGSVYAFFMFSVTQSSFVEGRCPVQVALPVLVGWTFLCAFFREGERHGYAALVAGFTPVVLFLGTWM